MKRPGTSGPPTGPSPAPTSPRPSQSGNRQWRKAGTAASSCNRGACPDASQGATAPRSLRPPAACWPRHRRPQGRPPAHRCHWASLCPAAVPASAAASSSPSPLCPPPSPGSFSACPFSSLQLSLLLPGREYGVGRARDPHSACPKEVQSCPFRSLPWPTSKPCPSEDSPFGATPRIPGFTRGSGLLRSVAEGIPSPSPSGRVPQGCQAGESEHQPLRSEAAPQRLGTGVRRLSFQRGGGQTSYGRGTHAITALC